MFDFLGPTIFTFFWYIFYYPMSWVSSIFSKTGLNVDATALTTDWAHFIADSANSFNSIVPVHWFLTLLYVDLLFEVALSTFNIIKYLLNMIRGAGA